jgi:hypothetical protein
MALAGGVRPEDTRTRNVVGRWIAEAASETDGQRCLDLDAQRIQGRASKEILVSVFGPQSPGIGYAPLMNRMKRWANESPIEGWFPLSRGERSCCDVVRKTIVRPTLKHRPPRSRDRSRPNGVPDAGRHSFGARRAGEVRLDSLPHRRNFLSRLPSMLPRNGAVQEPISGLRGPAGGSSDRQGVGLVRDSVGRLLTLRQLAAPVFRRRHQILAGTNSWQTRRPTYLRKHRDCGSPNDSYGFSPSAPTDRRLFWDVVAATSTSGRVSSSAAKSRTGSTGTR